jgi:hypothetical protein
MLHVTAKGNLRFAGFRLLRINVIKPSLKEQKVEISNLKQNDLEQQKAYVRLEGELKATLQAMQ